MKVVAGAARPSPLGVASTPSRSIRLIICAFLEYTPHFSDSSSGDNDVFNEGKNPLTYAWLGTQLPASTDAAPPVVSAPCSPVVALIVAMDTAPPYPTIDKNSFGGPS